MLIVDWYTNQNIVQGFVSGFGGQKPELPEENQQGAPKWSKEGFLYAGHTQVLRVGCVQTLKGQQTQREQLIWNNRQRAIGQDRTSTQ